MSASISLAYGFKLQITETIAIVLDLASDPSILLEDAKKGVLTGDTTPSVSKAWTDERTIDGSDDLDLTALTMPAGSELNTRDFTGLKIAFIKISANENNNASGITFSGGGTFPYELFGGATEQIILKPKDIFMILLNVSVVVSSTIKNISVSGTNGDIYTIELAAG